MNELKIRTVREHGRFETTLYTKFYVHLSCHPGISYKPFTVLHTDTPVINLRFYLYEQLYLE